MRVRIWTIYEIPIKEITRFRKSAGAIPIYRPSKRVRIGGWGPPAAVPAHGCCMYSGVRHGQNKTNKTSLCYSPPAPTPPLLFWIHDFEISILHFHALRTSVARGTLNPETFE